jgi:hypothetical protein
MKSPPTKGPRPGKNRGPCKTNQFHHTNSYRDFQLSLAQRVGDVVAIGELIRLVLKIMPAQAGRHHREAA